jgi:Protein of unknown function (DUF742)
MSGGDPGEVGQAWSRRYRRPYTVTGGRTRPARGDLELETLVVTVANVAPPAWLTREQHSIAALCQEIMSLAEISARLDLPLGVTRVVVGDMAADGLLLLYPPQDTVASYDLALLERVLHGLKNIP